jgi:hypothetical protein
MRARVTLATLLVGAVTSSLLVAGSALGGADVAAAQDRCLRGQWKMSNAASNAVLQSLIPNPNMRVKEGVITAAFPAGNTMRYGSTHFVLELAAGGLEMEGTATFITEAPWSTRGRNLVLGRGRSELVISKLKATKGGTTQTISGGPPIIRSTPRGSTPYTCNRNTLRWRIPLNGTQTLFRRVS